MKVHPWGELVFYGPDRQCRFEDRIEGELPQVEALELVGVPSATSRSSLPVAEDSGSMSGHGKRRCLTQPMIGP